jgi:hypothetical protein
MTAPETKGAPSRQGLISLLICLGVVGVLALYLYPRLLPSHPTFGAVYETVAVDLTEARQKKIGLFLRKHLPLRVLQSPYFPERYKDQPRYLNLLGNELEWSIGDATTGWLYFWDVKKLPRVSRWEFAPCSETNLFNVTSVPNEFYGPTNPGVTQAFIPGSSTNAIKVEMGQILFARLKEQQERIYILRLKEQNQNKLVVDYCVMIAPAPLGIPSK